MGSFNELGHIFGRMALNLPRAKHESLEEATKLVQETAKAAIGTYTFGWPPLAESTREDRARKGFAPDDPLRRTGGFAESIKRSAGSSEGYVGTNDPRGPMFEYGTSRMPPRPVLLPAFLQKQKEIETLIGRKLKGVLKFK